MISMRLKPLKCHKIYKRWWWNVLERHRII